MLRKDARNEQGWHHDDSSLMQNNLYQGYFDLKITIRCRYGFTDRFVMLACKRLSVNPYRACEAGIPPT